MSDTQIKYEYVQKYLTVVKGFSHNSIRCYGRKIQHILKILQKNELPSKKLINNLIYELKQNGRKNNSINAWINASNALYDYCKYSGLDVENFKLKCLPKNSTYTETLTPEEIKKILITRIKYGIFRGKSSDRLNDTISTFLYFLSVTGCRFSEAANLTPDRVKTDFVVFTETKNREWRKIPITKDLYECLLVESNRSGKFVFTTMAGNKMNQQCVKDALRKRAKLAGITKRVHPHLFRHSFATQLNKDGISIKNIAQLGGWKDLNTLQKYIHPDFEELKSSVMTHPINQSSMNSNDVIKNDLKVLKRLISIKDKRFTHEIVETEKGFILKVFKK